MNRGLKCLVCIDCQSVIQAHGVQEHFTHGHRSCHIKMPTAQITEIVESEHLLHGWPTIPSPPPVAYEGLPVISAFQCPYCPNLYSCFKSLGQHSSKTHNIYPSSDAIILRVSAQRLSFAAGGRSWFPVQPWPSHPTSPSEQTLASLCTSLDEHPIYITLGILYKIPCTRVYPGVSERMA